MNPAEDEMGHGLNRRAFFGTGAAALGGLAGARVAQADVVSAEDGFDYEIVRAPEVWRAQLGEHDFNILRLGATEEPKSSAVWNEEREGEYHCKGCELNVYSSAWKVPLDKGWAFFRHSVPNSLLMNIDWPDGAGPGQGLDILAAIEVHCRRCGGHMGHVLLVEGQLLHCINGASLTFAPAAA
jgi:peptide-methionine (R)-S-oxide reductase